MSPYFINDNVTVEIKLAEAQDVVLSRDKNTSYELSGLHLKWCSIANSTLAREIVSQYESGWGVHYDRVQFFRKENYQKSFTLINVNIRESVHSLRGVLILFKNSTDQVNSLVIKKPSTIRVLKRWK